MTISTLKTHTRIRLHKVKVNRAHKIKLKPTAEQLVVLRKAIGTARYTYNWALAQVKASLDANITYSIPELKKQWNKDKPSWVYEAPKDANQQPFTDLRNAFTKFFKKQTSFPAFKKKREGGSFYVSNDKIKVSDKYVQLPLIGKVRTTEAPRFTGKLLSATVSTRAGKWFVSLSYEFEKEAMEVPDRTVGIDLGIKTLATLSTGVTYSNPKALPKHLRSLRALNKHLSRKAKGSNNYKKCRLKLAKLHYRVSNLRNDNLHKTTTEIAKNHSTVVVETLSIKNMLKNRKLSRSLSDCGLYEFKRQLLYKAKKVIEADRFFPSSKLCSSCGSKKDNLLLSERTYKCTRCSLVIDRDLNASLNLSRLA